MTDPIIIHMTDSGKVLISNPGNTPILVRTSNKLIDDTDDEALKHYYGIDWVGYDPEYGRYIEEVLCS